MEKKRHSWGKIKTNKASIDFQKCLNCELYRLSVLGMWQYTKDNPSTLYVNACANEGCTK